jgi:hypothetical protein
MPSSEGHADVPERCHPRSRAIAFGSATGYYHIWRMAARLYFSLSTGPTICAVDERLSRRYDRLHGTRAVWRPRGPRSAWPVGIAQSHGLGLALLPVPAFGQPVQGAEPVSGCGRHGRARLPIVSDRAQVAAAWRFIVLGKSCARCFKVILTGLETSKRSRAPIARPGFVTVGRREGGMSRRLLLHRCIPISPTSRKGSPIW